MAEPIKDNFDSQEFFREIKKRAEGESVNTWELQATEWVRKIHFLYLVALASGFSSAQAYDLALRYVDNEMARLLWGEDEEEI